MRTRRIAGPLAAALLIGLPASASAAVVHVVAPGESLTSIAAADGLTVAQLAAANGLPPTAELIAGSQLVIPPQGEGELEASASAGPAVEAESSPSPAATEAEGDGDGDSDDGEITPASAATSQPVGEAAEGAPGAPPYPTSQTVSPAQVESIAAANGVPPSLANAIAYMESGFNNELVSSADARGVMQITPGTWSWIDRELAGSSPLSPESALDNVRAGVLLLRSLLEATGGDEALAIAGYYQGLPSVLENGSYPSTRQYVSDVQALQQRFGGG